MDQKARVKAQARIIEKPEKKIYYIIDLSDIVSEEVHDIIFNDEFGIKMERAVDLVELYTPDVSKYNKIEGVSIIILVPDSIYESEFCMFRLRLILNMLPIRYNHIFNNYTLNTFKNTVFCDTYKYKYVSIDDVAKLTKMGE